jgi:hypothetical protein
VTANFKLNEVELRVGRGGLEPELHRGLRDSRVVFKFIFKLKLSLRLPVPLPSPPSTGFGPSPSASTDANVSTLSRHDVIKLAA